MATKVAAVKAKTARELNHEANVRGWWGSEDYTAGFVSGRRQRGKSIGRGQQVNRRRKAAGEEG